MKQCLITVYLLFFIVKSYSQTNLILNSYSSPNVYKNQQRITLSDGMSASGSAGNSRFYIDPSISLNTNFPTSSSSYGTDPVVYNLDISKPVGTIPYSFDVSPIGSAECNVPIKCPIGTNNMQPNLSLQYSSLSGNGELGNGWSITGLQSIGRMGNTIYHNGGVSTINLTNTDNFSLNGNRLLVTSSTNGANGAVYTTEQNIFSRITSHGATGNGPSWFSVETKDGLILEFGNSSVSKLIPINGNTVLEWRISKITDQYGNYMVFDYYNAGGEILIKEIAYTGNQTLTAPYNAIKFYYDLKGDVNTRFIHGTEITEKSILRAIEIKHENNFVAQYNFEYVKYFNTTYLAGISLKGSDYTELNGLKFSYQNDDGAPSNHAASGLNSNMYSKYLLLDFTGDGKKDAVAFDATSYNAYYTTNFQWQSWRALKNNGGSSFSQVGSSNSFPSGFFPIEGIYGMSGSGSVGNFVYSAYDFNGDNKEDLVFHGKNLSGYTFNIYLSNGNGFSGTPISVTIQHSTFTSIHDVPDNKYWFTDINADGKTDILATIDNNTSANCSNCGGQILFFGILNAAAGGNFSPSSHNGSAFLACLNLNIDNAKIVEIEGDGKSDLLVSNYSPNSPSNSYSIVGMDNAGALSINALPASNAFASLNSPNYSIYGNNYNVTSGKAAFNLDGDFNGDGKSDFIISTQLSNTPPITSSYQLYFGKGDGTFTSPLALNVGALGLHNFVDNGYYYFTADMNGDGKTDIIEKGSGAIKIYYSKGNNGSDFFFSENYNSLGLNPSNFNITDVDGNGVNDIVSFLGWSNNTPPEIVYFYKGAKSKIIREIVDAFGKKTEILSAPLTDQSVYSQPTPLNSQTYPLSLQNAPLYVVKEIKTPNGIGGISTDVYEYENAINHKQGKGILCFSKITKTNVITDEKLVNEYSFNPNKFNVYLAKTSKYALNLNQLISDEVFTNINFTYGSLSFFSFINNSTQTNHLQNYTVYNQSTFDIDGNLTFTFKNINNGLDREETYYSSFVSNGSWMVNKPTNIYKVITRNGQAVYDGTTAFAYNTFGDILSITEEPGDAKQVVKLYSYNNNTGSLLSESINSPSSGLPFKLTTYVYDSKHRLRISETNPLNQTSNSKYNFIWGTPTEIEDFNGLKTLYTYDGFGRNLTREDPGGNITSNLHEWVTSADFSGNDPFNVNVCVNKLTIKNTGSPSFVTYYDLFGREIRNAKEGFNGDMHYTMIQYDAQGRKTDEAGLYQLIPNNPFTPLITTYTYDYLNRLVNKSTTDGTNTRYTSYSYAYNSGDLTVTTTDPDGKITAKTEDASGLLKSASDNGGIINYSYYSNRKIKTITVNGVQANYMEYDKFGRQTKLQDRDAGLTKYDYNAYGELASQTDANNKTYNFTYDALGRILTKMGPDGTYAYQYVSVGAGINNILQETAPNGYYTKYYYDQFGRNNKIEENIAGQSYFTNYTFDQYSRIEKTKYPSNYTIKNIYNIHGHLSQIIDETNNKPIWTCNSTNPFGKVSNYTSGNVKTTQVIQNNFGFPVQFDTPGVQSISNDFDFLNGNLKSKTDNLAGMVENYFYDGLDRLIKVQTTSLSDFNVAYNNSGNVLSKGNLGLFSYHNTKPDAVNNVTNPSGIINTNTQPNSLNIQNNSYTAFNKIQDLTENNYQYNVSYGCDQQRRMSKLYNNSNLDYTRIYVGDYEKTISGVSTTEVHYINSPSGLCGIYVITNGTGAMYFPYTDHLGSITKVINSGGIIVASLNYDAWGRRRNNTTWDYAAPTLPPSWLYRGYTGHEHLPEFELINMNGRLYDPMLGMMLSPDNFNQSGSLTQNYNRYAYALNNPLKYNDPTGNFWHLVVGAAIGGAVNVALHWNQIMTGGNMWKDMAVAFGIGAIGGAVAAATFGAGIAAVGTASGASAILAGMYVAGVSAVMGDNLTNLGNVIFFNDAPNTLKDNAKTFAISAGTYGVVKIVSNAVRPKNIHKSPNIKAEKNVMQDVDIDDPQLTTKSIMPKAEPSTVVDAPENLTLSQSVDLDGNIKINIQNTTGQNGLVLNAPDGSNIKIPANYYSSPANNGNGIVFRPMGSPANSNSNAIRIMGPTTYAPNGYAVFYNSTGQPINPSTGQTLSKAQWHYLFKK